MLFVLLFAAWLAVVLFGVTMCHLAALSDDSHAAAVADWMAAGRRPERRGAGSNASLKPRPLDRRRAGHRATG